jgi:hypothetical protein
VAPAAPPGTRGRSTPPERAGFGARPDEIAAGLAKGQTALVEDLVDRRVDVEPFSSRSSWS